VGINAGLLYHNRESISRKTYTITLLVSLYSCSRSRSWGDRRRCRDACSSWRRVIRRRGLGCRCRPGSRRFTLRNWPRTWPTGCRLTGSRCCLSRCWLACPGCWRSFKFPRFAAGTAEERETED
jgi:hypothetical protein